MGYFSKLDRSSRLEETPPLPAAHRPEPEPVSAQPDARETATPNAELAARREACRWSCPGICGKGEFPLHSGGLGAWPRYG